MVAQPLREVGKQYIDYLEKRYRAKVVEFSVRYKNPNWTPPYLRAVFDNGQVFCKQFYETEYGYAFDKMKRESCYSCNFKGDTSFRYNLEMVGVLVKTLKAIIHLEYLLPSYIQRRETA